MIDVEVALQAAEQAERDDQVHAGTLREVVTEARAELAAAEAGFEAAVLSADRKAAATAAERVADARDRLDLAVDAVLSHQVEAVTRAGAADQTRCEVAEQRNRSAARALADAEHEARQAEAAVSGARWAALSVGDRIEAARRQLANHRAAVEASRQQRVAAIRNSVL